MRWKIGQFIFCDQKQSLTTENETIQLEPLLVDVLSFFCRHPDEMVSRDKLIEEVWQSKVITDNAVNRVIAKLRKVLDDDPRSPSFIATFPKKGYRFIASVAELSLEDNGSVNGVENASKRLISWRLTILILITIITTFSAGQFLLEQSLFDNQTSQVYKVNALTRGGGSENLPSVSPNGDYLLYTLMSDNRMRLYVKSLETEASKEIGLEDGWSGPASWSNDGQYVVFLNTTLNGCRYYLLKMNGLEVIDRQLIHNCPVGSAGRMIFSHDDNQLIYAESKGRSFPHEIFILNRETLEKRKLPQPTLVAGGNTQFDLHPSENKLLISSPDEQQWLAFYSLDLDKEELTFLFKLEGWLCCAIWKQGGDGVVLMGEHPSYQLVSYDLGGKKRQVVYDAAQMVMLPQRFPNGKDYVFVGGNRNRDISWLDPNNLQKTRLVDSSVDDRIATLNKDASIIAYVSEKSGAEQVWLKSLKDHSDRKLTNFQENRRYFSLAWSPDNRWIAAKGLNEIHLIDVITGKEQKLKIPQTDIRAISWLDSQTLSYSTPKATAPGEWQIFLYDLEHHTSTAQQNKWRYIHYASDPQDNLYVDQLGNLFWGDDKRPLAQSDTVLNRNRRFSPVKHGNQVFYLDWHQGQLALFAIGIEENAQAIRLVNSVEDFSVSDVGIVYSYTADESAEIYRTVSH